MSECKCNELYEVRAKLADMICRYNHEKNTFYKAMELDGALREVRKIAQDADIHVIVAIIDKTIGKEPQREQPKKDGGQIDLFEVIPKG